MIHTTLNGKDMVLLGVCMTGRSVSRKNHQSSRKRDIYHQFLFRTVFLFLCTEGPENKKLLPKPRASDVVQVHSVFALCKRCIRASSPLPKTTRHPRSLQVRDGNYI